ncbi:hypothetical protein FCG67_10680 [Rhodococcus oryzae]|uniref:Uncharacterized protein n=1 Tax=Rhodococcus oryzae TaxID=2571143 RepID=A0ABY2RL74_9NOCA|nr:hypothetical protein FCG67_10680 [Rhodococcus oryzae]
MNVEQHSIVARHGVVGRHSKVTVRGRPLSQTRFVRVVWTRGRRRRHRATPPLLPPVLPTARIRTAQRGQGHFDSRRRRCPDRRRGGGARGSDVRGPLRRGRRRDRRIGGRGAVRTGAAVRSSGRTRARGRALPLIRARGLRARTCRPGNQRPKRTTIAAHGRYSV